MATPNQDSTNTGVPVTVTFTEKNRECLPPSIRDAFLNANWRVNFPNTNTSGSTVTTGIGISALQNNIARLDSQGLLYVPGIIKVELNEQTATLTSTTAPGTPVDLVFSAPGVPDLQNSMVNVSFSIEPPEAPVNIIGPFYSGGTLRYSAFRVETDDTPPYDEIVVRGDGRIFVIPSAATV